MTTMQIAISAIGLWISIIVPMGAMFAFIYNKIERNDNRWAELLTAFCDFKNVTVERFAKLENADSKDSGQK